LLELLKITAELRPTDPALTAASPPPAPVDVTAKTLFEKAVGKENVTLDEPAMLTDPH